MDVQQNVIVATVRDLLGELQQLKQQQDGLETVNPAKATYLQSQIWRKLTVIESLMESCPEAKAVIEKEVANKRKELKAETEDLKLMPVPKAVDAKTLQGWLDAEEGKMEERFPHYLQLPPEMREAILLNLTSTTDQFHCGQVLPADGDMMRWDFEALQFQKVLSIMISRSIPVSYQDIVNLSLAGGYMKVAVSNWFESYLQDTFIDKKEHDYNRRGWLKFKNLINLTNIEYTLNPIPACVILNFSSNDDEEEEAEEYLQNQLRILRQMGENIRECKIHIDEMTAMQSIERIRDCLALMPNLKYLSLDFYDLLDDQEDIGYFDQVELPDLPKLLGLDFGLIDCYALATKISSKYQSSLTGLKTDFSNYIPLLPKEVTCPYPRLTFLEVFLEANQNQVLLEYFQRLGRIGGSALKFLRIHLYSFEGWTAECFKGLMCCANHFGRTLEQLCLCFAPYPHISTQLLDLSWLATLEFPKVKSLTITGLPYTWTFLLKFPALENLTWYYRPGKWIWSFVPSNHFNLSWKKSDMDASNIWKMLPSLQCINFFRDREYQAVRTRSESLAYQNKFKTKMPVRKTQAERKQGWGTRKSARIANHSGRKNLKCGQGRN